MPANRKQLVKGVVGVTRFIAQKIRLPRHVAVKVVIHPFRTGSRSAVNCVSRGDRAVRKIPPRVAARHSSSLQRILLNLKRLLAGFIPYPSRDHRGAGLRMPACKLVERRNIFVKIRGAALQLAVVGKKFINMNTPAAVRIHFANQISVKIEFPVCDRLNHVVEIIRERGPFDRAADIPKTVLHVSPRRDTAQTVYKTKRISLSVVRESRNAAPRVLRFKDPPLPVRHHPLLSPVNHGISEPVPIRNLTLDQNFLHPVRPERISPPLRHPVTIPGFNHPPAAVGLERNGITESPFRHRGRDRRIR